MFHKFGLQTSINEHCIYKIDDLDMNDIYSINKQINAKTGADTGGATTFELVKAQVAKLGGDISKVVDIRTGEQQVLEHIKPEQNKSVTITENGMTSVLPDEGSVLNKVDVTVNVAGGGGAAVFHGSNPKFGNIEGDFPNAIFPDLTSCEKMFYSCAKLTTVPLFDISNVTNISYMFNGCSSLTAVPLFDTSNVTDIGGMFYDCSSLTTVPLFGTSNVTNMSYMFNGCRSLTTVPLFGTSNVTNMSYMFNGCRSLTTLPLFDTSNVANISSMFSGCSSLTTVPLFDTSNVTNMSRMFYNCRSLTTVPLFDTSNVTIMSGMFNSCSSLTTVPLFDTSNVTNIGSMFNGCSSLTTVPQFNASQVTKIDNLTFRDCISLTNFGGLLNIGQAHASKFIYDLSSCSQLTDESIQNVIDGLYDMTSKSFTPALKFHSTVFAKLSEEQKTQITAKKWTVTA